MIRCSSLHSLFVALLGLCAACASSAQTWEPLLRPDASWDVGQYESSTICGWVQAQTYFILGDTLLAGETYARLGFNMVQDNDGPPFCPPGYYVAPGATRTDLCLREDTVAGLVFQYDHALGVEHILYDYNVLVGDTIHGYFDFDQLGFPPTPTVVVSVDSVQLSDGVFHRRWGLGTELWDPVMHDYIEGVGSNFGVVHEVPQYYGDGPHLWCYKRNHVDVLWSVVHCPLPGSVAVSEAARGQGTDAPALSIASDGSVVVTGHSRVDVRIRALDGGLVLRASMEPGRPRMLPRVSPGVYTYSLTVSGERVRAGSFVLP